MDYFYAFGGKVILVEIKLTERSDIHKSSISNLQ